MPQEKKKVAVITGGSGFIGGAVARELAKRGWDVASLSRTSAAFDGVDSYLCDITDEKSVETAIQAIVKKHEHIDACIHTASQKTTRVPMIETSTAAFDMEFDVAVRGAFLLMRAALPHMQKDSAFVGITSRSLEGARIEKKLGAYLPAKHALHEFLKVLSYELPDIRVYAVAPPFLAGGLNKDLPQGVQELLARQPDGALASVEDVGRVVADLCSDPSAFPSGTSIALPTRSTTPL